MPRPGVSSRRFAAASPPEADAAPPWPLYSGTGGVALLNGRIGACEQASPLARFELVVVCVQPVEQRSVVLVDDVALHFQCRCQLAAFLGEVVVEQHELFGLLGLG